MATATAAAAAATATPIPEKFLIKNIFDQADEGFIFDEVFVVITGKLTRKGSFMTVEGTDAGGSKFTVEVVFPDDVKVSQN